MQVFGRFVWARSFDTSFHKRTKAFNRDILQHLGRFKGCENEKVLSNTHEALRKIPAAHLRRHNVADKNGTSRQLFRTKLAPDIFGENLRTYLKMLCRRILDIF